MRIIIVAVFAITRKNILIFFYFTNLVIFALVRKAEKKKHMHLQFPNNCWVCNFKNY